MFIQAAGAAIDDRRKARANATKLRVKDRIRARKEFGNHVPAQSKAELDAADAVLAKLDAAEAESESVSGHKHHSPDAGA